MRGGEYSKLSERSKSCIPTFAHCAYIILKVVKWKYQNCDDYTNWLVPFTQQFTCLPARHVTNIEENFWWEGCIICM